MKSIGNVAKYTLLALWLLAVGTLIAFGVKQATEVAYKGKSVQKETLALLPNDTLFVQFKYNDFYSKDFHHNDFELTQDENENEVIYSNDIRLEVLYTDESQPYLSIERKAEGKSLVDAKKRAEKIKYNFKYEGNKLLLNNYLTTDLKNKYRNQKVNLYLYVPKGTILKPDNSVKNYDNSENSFFNLHHSSDTYIYQVGDRKIICLNCPSDENEYNDVVSDSLSENRSTSITIDQNGVRIKENNKEVDSRDFKGLEINDEGIIIKTN